MAMLQVSEMIAAREVLSYAASCAARCQIVGFNRFMIWKTAHVATIPNAGRMTCPQYTTTDTYLDALTASKKSGALFTYVVANNSPQSQQYSVERAAIPEFMAAENEGRAKYILDYAGWETVTVAPGTPEVDNGFTPQVAHVTASQSFTNMLPFHRAFYDGDSVDMQATADMENHYPLYLTFDAADQ